MCFVLQLVCCAGKSEDVMIIITVVFVIFVLIAVLGVGGSHDICSPDECRH